MLDILLQNNKTGHGEPREREKKTRQILHVVAHVETQKLISWK
jgi:hypothetical protein